MWDLSFPTRDRTNIPCIGRKHPFQFSEAAGVEILSKGTGGPSVLHSCIVLGPRGPDGEGAAAAFLSEWGPVRAEAVVGKGAAASNLTLSLHSPLYPRPRAGSFPAPAWNFCWIPKSSCPLCPMQYHFSTKAASPVR
ncbi:hypothetical protein J1605_007069 [Eschrichtius robustus]|uniref:Uncharacterized protein n=1 Tax=Eschrichtius robustus TaxID=9764 RepID=A0AB34H206_ESCRO|nr:hypothetical protein J1605_007069 [Eschrichtius robustus]